MTSLRDVKDFKDLVHVPNLNEQVIYDFRAKTGTKRVSPVMYFPQEDGSMVILASDQGAPTNPAWYHNLKANPWTDVEAGA